MYIFLLRKLKKKQIMILAFDRKQYNIRFKKNVYENTMLYVNKKMYQKCMKLL